MKKLISKILATTAFSILTLQPSFAGDWDGFYIGVDAGQLSDHVNLIVNPFTQIGSDQGPVYGLNVGYDMNILPTNILVGAYARASQFQFSPLNSGSSSPKVYDLGFRAGYLLLNQNLFLGLMGGYSQSAHNNNTINFEGFHRGFTAEYKLTNDIFVNTKLIYREMLSPTGNVQEEHDQISVGLSYKF